MIRTMIDPTVTPIVARGTYIAPRMVTFQDSMIVRESTLIGTDISVVTVWTPLDSANRYDYATITHFDGALYGDITSLRPTLPIDALPARSIARTEAVRGWYRARKLIAKCIASQALGRTVDDSEL